MARLLESEDPKLSLIEHLLPDRANVEAALAAAVIPCPDCHCAMTVKRFFPGNVVIDVCPDHGIWFDVDELRRILRAEVHRRRVAAQRPARAARAAHGDGSPESDGGSGESTAPEAVIVLAELLAIVLGS